MERVNGAARTPEIAIRSIFLVLSRVSFMLLALMSQNKLGRRQPIPLRRFSFLFPSLPSPCVFSPGVSKQTVQFTMSSRFFTDVFPFADISPHAFL